MAATWPATLPPPLIEGHAASVAVPAVRLDLGVGWTDARRRAGSLPQTARASWLLSAEQARDFVLFARDHAGEWSTFAIRVSTDAAEVAEVRARFAGDVDMQPVGDAWAVAVELEISA